MGTGWGAGRGASTGRKLRWSARIDRSAWRIQVVTCPWTSVQRRCPGAVDFRFGNSPDLSAGRVAPVRWRALKVTETMSLAKREYDSFGGSRAGNCAPFEHNGGVSKEIKVFAGRSARVEDLVGRACSCAKWPVIVGETRHAVGLPDHRDQRSGAVAQGSRAGFALVFLMQDGKY